MLTHKPITLIGSSSQPAGFNRPLEKGKLTMANKTTTPNAFANLPTIAADGVGGDKPFNFIMTAENRRRLNIVRGMTGAKLQVLANAIITAGLDAYEAQTAAPAPARKAKAAKAKPVTAEVAAE